tara:strand:+ start:37 stop:579 length:543 start_codon:yes stop_codon:yes gene_type:complete
MKLNNHLFESALFIESPNHDTRPKGLAIDLIVIHAISLPLGQYITENIIKLFTNNLDPKDDDSFKEISELKVSSHILITRTGEIIQFVPFNKRAWHAGVSNYMGRENCNNFSIGIELEGTDYEEFDNKQYETLNKVLESLFEEYDIHIDHVVGHSEIAPNRKTDPGPFFDWNKLCLGNRK